MAAVRLHASASQMSSARSRSAVRVLKALRILYCRPRALFEKRKRNESVTGFFRGADGGRGLLMNGTWVGTSWGSPWAFCPRCEHSQLSLLARMWVLILWRKPRLLSRQNEDFILKGSFSRECCLLAAWNKPTELEAAALWGAFTLAYEVLCML